MKSKTIYFKSTQTYVITEDTYYAVEATNEDEAFEMLIAFQHAGAQYPEIKVLGTIDSDREEYNDQPPEVDRVRRVPKKVLRLAESKSDELRSL